MRSLGLQGPQLLQLGGAHSGGARVEQGVGDGAHSLHHIPQASQLLLGVDQLALQVIVLMCSGGGVATTQLLLRQATEQALLGMQQEVVGMGMVWQRWLAVLVGDTQLLGRVSWRDLLRAETIGESHLGTKYL